MSPLFVRWPGPFPSPSSSFIPPPYEYPLCPSMESDSDLKPQSNGWYTTPPPTTITIPSLDEPEPHRPSSSSPSTPSSSTSSSPSTTAFVTPASSLGTDPSNPPSPSLAVVGLPACLTAITALSMRPAPPSPALSKRQSAISVLSRSLSRPVSRPLSGVAGAQDPATKAPPTTITAQPLCQEPVSTEPPTPPIKIRDYAFELTDDRFHGLGPFVPKWNRVERLNRVLLEAKRNDEEMQERRARKERRRQKREKREKRRKKKTINGWSDSDESEDGEREEDNNNSKDESDSEGTSSSSESGSENQGGDEDGMPGVDGDDDDDDDEKYMGAGGWGGFRFGRLSWNNAGGGQSSQDGKNQVGLAGFPSRMDFDRNFGEEEGADVDDSHQSTSPPEPYPFEDAGVDEDFRVYQGEGYHYGDEYHQDHKDFQEPHEPPLLPGLYRALYVFEPEGAAEMGLVEDQVVRVVGRGGGVGWAVVIDEREERKGGNALVPESYLELVRVDEDDANAE